MKTPKALYVLITLFCIFAIIAGAYAEFVEQASVDDLIPIEDNNNNEILEKDAETIKAELNALFTNVVNLNGADTTGIIKNKEDKEIVYTAYDISKSEANYEINIKIPVINIKGEIPDSFNTNTQTIFVNKANEILNGQNASSKIIYSIDYAGYVNGDILSLVIRSTIKEGNNAQRVIIQTYNYNFRTNTTVSLNDLITLKSINRSEAEEKIKKAIKEADDEAKVIQNMGYNNIYSRNLDDEIYTVDGSSTYFLGEDMKLYIVYPYGNQNYTSVMDVVLFE